MAGEPSDEIARLFAARATEFVAAYSYDFLGSQFREALENLCQSPIEQRMLIELAFAEWGYASCLELGFGGFSEGRPQIALCCQYPVPPYSVDVAVLAGATSGKILKVAVECDGHDFHERTKEQAAHDKERDRALQLGGWIVLRYTGSEIFRRGRSCAAEVANHVSRWIHENEQE